MTEPVSDALFGVDGTELPSLSPDPLGRGRWQDAPALPSLPLPPIPDLNTTRDAIAATLDEDPGGPIDQDPGVVPAAAPAPPSVPPGSAAPASATAPLPVPPVAESARPPSAGGPRVVVSPVSPAQPGRGGAGPASRSSLVAGSFPRVQLRDPRRRLGRLARSFPTQSRSNGGAGAFFVISLITFAVLLYFIIDGIVESFTNLYRMLP